jgi:hypothetical protein
MMARRSVVMEERALSAAECARTDGVPLRRVRIAAGLRRWDSDNLSTVARQGDERGVQQHGCQCPDDEQAAVASLRIADGPAGNNVVSRKASNLSALSRVNVVVIA